MSNPNPEFNFEHGLPAGKEWFSLRYLAKLWECSEDTIRRLIDTGDLYIAVDIAPKTSVVKAMIRIPRVAVIEFLKRRGK